MNEPLATRRLSVIFSMVLAFGIPASATDSTAEPVTLVDDGRPAATIIVAQAPTPSANFAALELRYHIQRITGVELPVVDDSQAVTGNRILVGHSNATAALGINVGDFEPLEYRIQIDPGTIVLLGRDWQDTPVNRAEAGRSVSGYTLQSARQVVNYSQLTGGFGPSSIELPGLFDEQGTCYAVYDFLERFLRCPLVWAHHTEYRFAVNKDALGNDRHDSAKQRLQAG